MGLRSVASQQASQVKVDTWLPHVSPRLRTQEHTTTALEEWAKQAAHRLVTASGSAYRAGHERCQMWCRNVQTLCGILGLSISLGVTCLYAQESRDEVIKQQCALKWPDNLQTQADCIEQQIKGRESLSRPVDPHVSPEEHAKLRAHCEKKWPDDFKMRAYCEERQITGLRELQSPLPQDMTSKEFSIAMTHCTKEWPDDFKMRASCLHQQTEALRKLKRQ